MENPVLGKHSLFRTGQKHPLWVPAGQDPREPQDPRGGGAAGGVSLPPAHGPALGFVCALGMRE